jgi:3-phenylpropionate/cinnamic acid dioxygenase small subunit
MNFLNNNASRTKQSHKCNYEQFIKKNSTKDEWDGTACAVVKQLYNWQLVHKKIFLDHKIT